MKHLALILSTIAAALLVVAVAGVADRMGVPRHMSFPPQVSVTGLSPQEIRDQAQFQHSLQVLLNKKASQAPLDANSYGSRRPMEFHDGLFAMVEQAPAAPGRAAAPAADTTIEALPKVSVVVQAGSEGKAVINGRLVRVGDAVADGLVVADIQVNAVTFQRGDKQLQVNVPVERLRVLGAAPQGSARP